jgi:hypothetical protein
MGICGGFNMSNVSKELIDVPKGMNIVKSILVKRLQTPGYFADVYLVSQNGQYEAALFINDKFKPGPPIPYPLDKPTDEVTHWMGVRPSVGLSPEEADRIINEVESENAIHRKKLQDRWNKRDIL